MVLVIRWRRGSPAGPTWLGRTGDSVAGMTPGGRMASQATAFCSALSLLAQGWRVFLKVSSGEIKTQGRLEMERARCGRWVGAGRVVRRRSGGGSRSRTGTRERERERDRAGELVGAWRWPELSPLVCHGRTRGEREQRGLCERQRKMRLDGYLGQRRRHVLVYINQLKKVIFIKKCFYSFKCIKLKNLYLYL